MRMKIHTFLPAMFLLAILCGTGFWLAAREIGAAIEPREDASIYRNTGGWREALPGLSFRIATVAGGAARMILVRADLNFFNLSAVDALKIDRGIRTAEELVINHRAAGAINGGYFDKDGTPLGLLIHQGQTIRSLRPVDWGIFLIRGGKAEIRHTRDGVPAGTEEAIQCGPRLVIEGDIPGFYPEISARSGIGIDPEGRVVLAATSQGELSLRQFALALKTFGCVNAMNLDGGPSTQLFIKAGKTLLDVPGGYGIPTALLLVPRT